MKSHVPTNTKLHIAWKIVHKIRTSNYSGRVGHAQVPITHKNKQQSQKVLRGGTLEEGKSQCFLGFCLTLWSLIHLTDVCGLDTIHTISCYFTTLFPHLSAMCFAQLSYLGSSNLVTSPISAN